MNRFCYRTAFGLAPLCLALLLPFAGLAQSPPDITLRATNAKLVGPSVKMNHATQVAAYWKGPEDRAIWKFKAEKEGRVDILLIYGVPDQVANQPLVIAVDGKTALEGKLPSTGGYARFRQHMIGTIQLAAGNHELIFRPQQQVRGDDLVDLKAIILTPHDPRRPKSSDAPSLQPVTDMLKHLQVPEGFVIEQVAGPPLVNRPISCDFDERGRLYVTESSGGNDNVRKQFEEKPHRIVRLVDTNGDGVFDKSTVFADRMMLPEGAMWHAGSLYVTAPPHIWKLTDVDDDGIADKREVWFDGKTLGGCANDLHGPYLGPDGWIYWCKGEFQKQTYERPGKPPLVTRAAHILRRHPSGGPVEIVMTGGMNNPVDVAFTPGGERIFSTTFLRLPAGGQRDGLIHAVYGGVYPRKNGVLAGHPRTGELMPVLTHMGVAAPCGLIRLETSQLGDGFRDNLLACQFNTHKVSRHVLAPRGATFITQDEDFVTSEHVDFHPTDVLEDADGSVLVVNTGGWYMLCCPTSRLHKPDVLGAIYRVRRAGKPQVEDPRGLTLDWSVPQLEQLTQRLHDGRPAIRRRASEQLVTLGDQAVPELSQVLENSPSADARLQATWALTRIDHPSARKSVHTALTDADEQVRQAAIHSAALWKDASALPTLTALLNHKSLHNRRAAAEALGRIGNHDSIAPLLAASADYRGRFLDHSLVYALIELGNSQQVRTQLTADKAHTRRAAMLALENLAAEQLNPKSVIELLDSNEPLMADSAWWITQRHPEWAPVMADFFKQGITDPNLTPAQATSLSRQLARFSESPRIQKIMSTSLGKPNAPQTTKVAILSAISSSRLPTLPDTTWKALSQLLAEGNETLLDHTVKAIHAHAPSPLTDDLKRVANNPRRNMETRLRALASGKPGQQLADTWIPILGSELNSARPVRNRSLATDILVNAQLTDSQLIRLAPALTKTASTDLKRLLATFEQSTSDRVGNQLVAALNASPTATALDKQAVDRVLSQFHPAVSQQAKPLLDRIAAAANERAAKFDAVLDLIDQGDVRRGQEVFYGTKASCSACHAVGYRGGRVGPDLTHVGRIRDNRSLLESILYPSASFVQSYEPINLVTTDGKVYNGVLKEENAREIVLSLDAEKTLRIRHNDIEVRRNGTVSIMPQGLEKQLTSQQLADLLVFLKSAK